MPSSNFLSIFFDSFSKHSINELFSIAGSLTRLNGSNINPLNCTILDNRVFQNFILADEPLAKALGIF